MSYPRFALAFLLSLTLTNSVPAQETGGFTVQKRRGFALVKPQVWDKPSEAVVVEFEALTDRTVRGTPGAGYYEFQTKTQDRRQVPAARIVRLVLYPDPSQFTHVVEPDERDAIASTIANLEKLAAEFPNAKAQVEGPIRLLRMEVARYDRGEIKVEGVWKDRGTYQATQAAVLGRQLLAELRAAKKSEALDLETDGRFLTLQEMAASNPDAARLVGEIQSAMSAKQRAEARAQILLLLASAETSFPAAESAVVRLQALNPDEDPKAGSLLRSWDQGRKAIIDLNARAQGVADQLGRESESAGEGLPQISPATLSSARDLRSQLRIIESSGPPPALLTLANPSRNVATAVDALNRASLAIQANEFLQAKDALDEMAAASESVGPAARKVAARMGQQATAKIEEFTRLRQEGDLLLGSGKTAEAVTKYEEALAVIPDKELSEKVTQLKAPAN